MHPDAVTERLQNISEDVKEIKTLLENHYVTRHEFAPVRLIVFGMTGGILLAVLGAIVASVVRASI